MIERTPEDLLKTVYLCINRVSLSSRSPVADCADKRWLPSLQLAPEYESIELGIGESLLMKAIGESCGRTLAQVKAEYKKIGDLGEVAFNSRTRQKTLFKTKPLTVKGVFDELKKVAKTSGKDVRRLRPFLRLQRWGADLIGPDVRENRVKGARSA